MVRRSSLAAVMTCLVASVLFAPSSEASVGARLARPGGDLGNLFALQGEGGSRAQTFTSETDGFLGSIEVTLISDAPGSPYALGPSIELQVWGTNAGVPDGANSNLGSVTRLGSELGDLQLARIVSFDCASLEIPVRRNEAFSIVGPQVKM